MTKKYSCVYSSAVHELLLVGGFSGGVTAVSARHIGRALLCAAQTIGRTWKLVARGIHIDIHVCVDGNAGASTRPACVPDVQRRATACRCRP